MRRSVWSAIAIRIVDSVLPASIDDAGHVGVGIYVVRMPVGRAGCSVDCLLERELHDGIRFGRMLDARRAARSAIVGVVVEWIRCWWRWE